MRHRACLLPSWRLRDNSEDMSSSCFANANNTKYVCIEYRMPICDKCSIFVNNEDTVGWTAGRSFGHCEPCFKASTVNKHIFTSCRLLVTMKWNRVCILFLLILALSIIVHKRNSFYMGRLSRLLASSAMFTLCLKTADISICFGWNWIKFGESSSTSESTGVLLLIWVGLNSN